MSSRSSGIVRDIFKSPLVLHEERVTNTTRCFNISRFFFTIAIISGYAAMGIVTGLSIKSLSSKRIIHMTGIITGWSVVGLITLAALIILNKLHKNVVQANKDFKFSDGKYDGFREIKRKIHKVFEKKGILKGNRTSEGIVEKRRITELMEQNKWQELLELYKENAKQQSLEE